jgi:hypothetical protein
MFEASGRRGRADVHTHSLAGRAEDLFSQNATAKMRRCTQRIKK